MRKRDRVSPQDYDNMSPEKRAFFESALREMKKLDEEAGDWRLHLPYEAMIGYRKNSAIRKQYADHYNNCSFCKEAVDTLNPYDE